MDVQHLHDVMLSEIRRLESLIESHAELHRAQREDDSEAVRKAEDSVNRRLEEMNNLRQQITVERGSYASRDMLDQVISGAYDRISAVERWQFKLIGALVMLTFAMPTVTGVAVYFLTRHAIPVVQK